MSSSFSSQVYFVLIVLCLHVSSNLASDISIKIIPPSPKTGEPVTLSVLGITGNIRFSTWYKGQSTNAVDQILNYFPPSHEIKGDKYFKEAQGRPNGSLVITDFQDKFKGYYTVQIQTDSDLLQSSVEVTVNGIAHTVLSPSAILLGTVLFSAINFL